ncbi:GNAT family N-acetyltransferase [Streptosporangium sp. NPDC000396]|uniref:GNAT family N-acetyltransferase n=1 Tax=Streptosporangium sp. NPDC000396 TaxID=3366185 RepID=UPI0036A49F57
MIHLARPEDLPVIEGIVAEAYQPWAELIGIRPKPMDDDYAAHVAAGYVHLLEEEGETAGLIVLIPEDGVLLVDNVAVAPGRHGRGLGKRLLAFAEAQAREAGLGALRLITNALMKPNIALYERLGYEITDRRRSGPRDVVFMRKRLTE